MLVGVTVHNHVISPTFQAFPEEGPVMAMQKRDPLAIHKKFGE